VKFRNISGSTKSEEGRSFRDGLMILKQICHRLGENFWGYLKNWCRREPIDLAEHIRQRYRAEADPLKLPSEIMASAAMP
jgi:hypothetical protein